MTTFLPKPMPSVKEMTNSLPAPGKTCQIGVSSASGDCPLGFMYEDRWEIDERGQTNYPLCQPAIDALTPILKRISKGIDFDSRGQCVCPYNGCRLTFVVHCRDNLKP